MKARNGQTGATTSVLRVPALEIKQRSKRLYAFSVDAKLIPAFATVSRVRRSEDGLFGYQRPEQLNHVWEIKTYVESADSLLPTAVVIAFDKRVKFRPTAGPAISYVRTGELEIPIDPSLPEHRRPGFVVDGQQRIAAIRDAEISAFPICVTAFIAADTRLQTEQFILVNSTKPLPKGLMYELLPATDALLPRQLERRRLPAVLVTRLNEDSASPLHRAIRVATNPEGRIKDNSLLKLIENSMSDGLLYGFRARDEEQDTDVDGMYSVLADFFAAVKEVFPEAWELPPKRSRLTHGVGIAALGFLMDRIAHRIKGTKPPTRRQFRADLERLADVCHWTDGIWKFGPGQHRRWDELQNTRADVELLLRFLRTAYQKRVLGMQRSHAR